MTSLQRPNIWIEVDDLISHFTYSDQPTGIQRVLLELIAVSNQRSMPHVRLCRLNAHTGKFEVLDTTSLQAIITRAKREARLYRRLGRIHRRLGILARDFLRMGADSRRDRAGRPDNVLRFNSAMRPGDLLVSMGASWANRQFGAMLAEHKARHGFRFVQLVNDIIPITHDEISNPEFVATFKTWLHSTAQSVDLYLLPSRHVASELARYASSQGWPKRPMIHIRFGTGFGSMTPAPPSPATINEPFVLCVATVDLRKNTALLIAVWEQLVARHGADKVPLLLLAGHRGYRSAEIFDRLRTNNFVAGRIRFVERVSDDELKALYRDTLFSVFPSRAEGWGLPVEEGLSYGKFGICSNATSIPEVGGDLVDYFNPMDADSAYLAIERAIFDPDYVAAKEGVIRTNFRPVPWTETFDRLVAMLERFATAPADVDPDPVS